MTQGCALNNVRREGVPKPACTWYSKLEDCFVQAVLDKTHSSICSTSLVQTSVLFPKPVDPSAVEGLIQKDDIGGGV